MASDGSTLRLEAIPLRIAPWISEAAFVALLLLGFVGLTPFSPPPSVAEFGGAAVGGAGDALRQVFYVIVFGVLLLSALQKRGLATIAVMPVLLALLLAWCAASALWAAEPGVAFRRAGLEIILALSVMLGVDVVGAERSLALWRWLLLAILVVNWASIPLIHTAVHNPGEQDPGLVGDWRGLYGHKNIAGAVAVFTVLLFTWSAFETRRLLDVAAIGLALGFLVMTRSKSSLGLLPVALAAGAVYRFGWRSSLDRYIVCIAAAVLIGALVVFVVLDAGAIARVLEDPAEFTGRAAIWQAELAYIRDHLLLGSGFGTFSDTGGLSPLRNYVANGDWVNAVSHGHNGYLQLMVTTGAVGIALAFAALIAAPLVYFWKIDPSRLWLKSLLFAIYVFLILHNVMESDFLEGDGTTWVAFLLMLAMLGASDRAAKRERAEAAP
jgi:O-antigen ligase